MERDIKAERTFTSLADKLYFLCELSWEMLSTDRLSLNYRAFPDRVRRLFGPAVQEQKDLDHWHYDMMGQTMLVRNNQGDYTPAHRSLLEFFVAYKLGAELGALAQDFTDLAREIVDGTLPRDYTWSEYAEHFRREVGEKGRDVLVPPLRNFSTEGLETLRGTWGKLPLTNATVDLLQNMLDPDKTRVRTTCLSAITGTQNKTFKEEDFTGGNIARVLIAYDPLSLRGADLRGANLQRADLRGANLQEANLQRADLRGANLQEANLQRADLQEADLRGANLQRADLQEADLYRTKLQGAKLQGASLYRAKLQEADLLEANLYRARITPEQLADTRSLQGATMPDGQILKSDDNPDRSTFEDWLREHE
jgi:uncharacterized protein YjbI with pentapeptide repeats